MKKFSFCRETIREKYASLLDAQIADDDPRYDDYEVIMGMEFLAEAHPSEAARDARLGQVSDHVEYVPASAEEVDSVDYPLYRMAIGPAVNEPGFDEVAEAVAGAAVEFFGDKATGQLDMTIVIARTEYSVRFQGTASSMVMAWRPLYGPQDRQDRSRAMDTVHWLRGFVNGRFAPLAA